MGGNGLRSLLVLSLVYGQATRVPVHPSTAEEKNKQWKLGPGVGLPKQAVKVAALRELVERRAVRTDDAHLPS